MTWYRVDDGFHSHAKVKRIPRAHRAAAIGTWTLCGTWSAEKELDGFVPEYMIEELGGTLEAAGHLVEVKLWRRRRDGFQFVNWDEYQFTRAQNVERRQAESQRKAEWRARKARKSAAVSEDVPPGQKRDDNTPSRPVPSRDDDTTVKSHPHVGKRELEDRTDLSPTVSSVVDNVAEHCGRKLHPLAVHDLVEWIEQRRGPRAEPLRNPARYYARVIRDSAFEVQQFIDEKGLAS